jgi:arabinogalactan oligomer/maltooligosaccharide transport system permease protein
MLSLALLDSLALYSAFVLFADGATLMLIGLIVGTLFINWVYLWPRTQALRWVTPGLVFMAIFVMVPIIYTSWVSMTNWRTGNVTTKEQTIEFWEAKVYVDPEDAGELYDLYVYTDDSGPDGVRLLLVSEDNEYIFGKARLRTDPPIDDAVEAEGSFSESDEIPPAEFDGFRLLSKRELFSLSTQIDFKVLVIDIDDGEVVILGLSQGRVVQASQRYVYDEASDILIDTIEDQDCSPGDSTQTKGNFICEDGTVLIPGWVTFIGFKNYTRVITNDLIRGPFMRIFVWNFMFALLSVALSFALGLALALTLHSERMKGLLFYRSIFIIPYAIPAFLSIIVWRGLLNSNFGTVNRLLQPVYDLLGTDPIPWLNNPTWAKISLLLVQLWLGFPYMFLLATGALQAIPEDILEAARVDGARAPTVFRRITFPLLMVALAPLLIGSFAFNFNNFNTIFLLTGGGPPVLGADVPVGHTDILISFTFNLASAAGRGNQFGLAAAITMFIFLIVLVISAFSFRFTKRLEDTYGGL